MSGKVRVRRRCLLNRKAIMDENKKNILVFLVDDDDFLLEMYALKFRNSGFSVEIAKNSQDALDKLKKGLKPDVVLLDVVMPQMDGFELLALARKENLLSGSRVVVLSNLGQKEDFEKGKELGVADYIIKASFTPSEVVKKVEEILQR